MSLYPVNLKISGCLCIVIGGGGVAKRKIRSLLEADAVVRVISPQVEPEISKLATEGTIEWFERPFAEGDLSEAFLVFAATNNREIQLQLEQESKRFGALFNSADDPVASGFHVPAHFRRGKLLVTISTGGGSPALAKMLREQLESNFTPDYAAVIELLAIIREEIVTCGGESQKHATIFNTLLDKGLLEMVLKADWFTLQMLLIEELPEQVDGVMLLKRFLREHDQTDTIEAQPLEKS